MLLRREFLGWIIGSWSILGCEKGTLVHLERDWSLPMWGRGLKHKRERPAESMQQLIQQIRFLEQGTGSRAHVQIIQDQIRSRLLLSGLACVYVEENGQPYICALETSTGCLWCLPLRQAVEPWARKAWKKIGLGGLENRVKTLSKACDL